MKHSEGATMKNLKRAISVLVVAVLLFATDAPVVAQAATLAERNAYNTAQRAGTEAATLPPLGDAALLTQAPSAADPSTGLASNGSLTNKDYDEISLAGLPKPSYHYDDFFVPATSEWLVLTAATPPAQLSGVEYALAPGVVELNSSNRNIIDTISSASMILSGSTEQVFSPNRLIEGGAYIPKSALAALSVQTGTAITPDTIIYDEATGTAFKVSYATDYTGIYSADQSLAPLRDTFTLAKPQIHEVIEDFIIPEQEIDLTEGNVESFGPGMERYAVPGSMMQASYRPEGFSPITGNKYVHNVLVGFEFPEVEVTGFFGVSSSIQVLLSGGIVIGDIGFKGKYTCFNGYGLFLTIAQEAWLNITFMSQADSTVKIPLVGVEIPLPGGRIAGGIFLIIELDGTFRIDIEAREYMEASFGIGGGTTFFIPRSIGPRVEFDPKFEGDLTISGCINAELKIGPEIELSAFGFTLLEIHLHLGIGFTASIEADATIIEARLYAFIRLGINLLDLFKQELINEEFTIMEKKLKNTEGYVAFIDDCILSPGRVGGTIKKEPPILNDPYVPAVGIRYKLKVTHADGTVDYFPSGEPNANSTNGWALTDQWGQFYQGDGMPGNPYGAFGDSSAGIPLTNGDMVTLLFVTPSGLLITGPSEAALFPYNSVRFFGADWYNDRLKGQVAPIKIRDYRLPPPDPAAVEAGLPRDDLKPVYLTNAVIEITQRIFIWIDGVQYYANLSEPVLVLTDEMGRFDVNAAFDAMVWDGKRYVSVKNYTTLPSGEKVANPGFNLSAGNPYTYLNVLIKHNRNSHEIEVQSYPGMGPLAISHVIYPVENSFKKTTEDGTLITSPEQLIGYEGKIIDSMQYDQYCYIINPIGTRAIQDDEFIFAFKMYSTWDVPPQGVYFGYSPTGHVTSTTASGEWDPKVIRIDNGDGTSTSIFGQRVTVEWVWQAHPDPVKITSDPVASIMPVAGEDRTFQVEAKGICPAFYLVGAPAGVTIDRDTGLMTIPEGLAPGTYSFKVCGVQEYRNELLAGFYELSNGEWVYGTGDEQGLGEVDSYRYTDAQWYGHDAMPPDEQDFMLIILQGAPALQPPVIAFNPTTFTIQQGTAFQTTYTLTGGTPDTVTVAAVNSSGASVAGFTITTGNRTVSAPNNLAAGTYTVTATAANGAGSRSASFTLTVTAPSTPGVDAPGIAFNPTTFTIQQGASFQTAYTLTGGAPDTVTIVATNSSGLLVTGFSVNTAARTVSAPSSLTTGTYTVTATATNSGGSNSASFTLTVNTPTPIRTPPVFVKGEHNDYTFTVRQDRLAPTTFDIHTTGSTPITYSLEPFVGPGGDSQEVPKGLEIDEKTGVLTVDTTVREGVYPFCIVAANDVGKTKQDCTLVVTNTIRIGFDSPGIGSGTILTAGLTFDTDESSAANASPVANPTQVSSTLDSALTTGDLGGISLIRPDEADLGGEDGSGSVTVTYPQIDHSLIGMAASQLKVVDAQRSWTGFLSSAERSAAPLQGILREFLEENVPLNDITVRWDDPGDIYTHDRATVNGVKALSWSSTPTITIKNEPIRQFYPGFSETIQGETHSNPITGILLYHNAQQAYESDQAAKGFERMRAWLAVMVTTTDNPAQDVLEGLIAKYGHEFAQWFFENAYDEFGNRTGGHPWDNPGIDPHGNLFYGSTIIGRQTLNYGDTVDAIGSQRGGAFTVELTDLTGTTVVSDYFAALRGNRQANLTFTQDGASITFAGRDVSGSLSPLASFDIGYSPGSRYEQDMLSAAGISGGGAEGGAGGGAGGSSFVFSFAGHGALPGMATFEISTDIAPGTNVNVYRYESDSGAFTQIATGVTVGAGGVVTYRNNTMSDYLITTSTIEGALIPPAPVNWLLIGIIAGVALLLAAAAVAFLVLRKKRSGGAGGRSGNGGSGGSKAGGSGGGFMADGAGAPPKPYTAILSVMLIIAMLFCVPLLTTACNKPTDTVPVGRYVLVDVTDDPDGTSFKTLDVMYKDMGLKIADNVYIEFTEGRRYTVVLFGKEQASGTYTRNEDTLTLTTDDGTVTATISGKKVTWTYENGAKLIFQRK